MPHTHTTKILQLALKQQRTSSSTSRVEDMALCLLWHLLQFLWFHLKSQMTERSLLRYPANGLTRRTIPCILCLSCMKLTSAAPHWSPLQQNYIKLQTSGSHKAAHSWLENKAAASQVDSYWWQLCQQVQQCYCLLQFAQTDSLKCTTSANLVVVAQSTQDAFCRSRQFLSHLGFTIL